MERKHYRVVAVIALLIILILIVLIKNWSNIFPRYCPEKNPDGSSGGPYANLCHHGKLKALEDISVCDNPKDDYCYLLVAEITSNISVCERIDNADSKDSCIKNIGWSLKDPGACDRIISEDTKNLCYSGIALRLEDERYCEKISVSYGDNGKDNCYWYLGSYLSKLGSCTHIENETLKASCIKYASGNFEVEPVKQNLNNSCYVVILPLVNNPVLICGKGSCEELNEPLRSDCLDFYAKKQNLSS